MVSYRRYFLTRYVLSSALGAVALLLLYFILFAIPPYPYVRANALAFGGILLMLLALWGCGLAVDKYPRRTKADICAVKGHKTDGCQCKRCKEIVDETKHRWDRCRCSQCGTRKNLDDPAHIWEGCKCTQCGLQKPNSDPQHDWDGCLCKHCGAIRDDGHSWKLESTKHYGGNDINGWGPGGETYTVYVCTRCGETRQEVDRDDDSDGDSESDSDNS